MRLGIMQGRLYPLSKKNFHLFPKKWKNEFSQIKKIGFNYIELLYDRDLSRFNPLISQDLDYKKILRYSKNKTYSVNLDFFTKNHIFKNINKNEKLLKKIINYSNNLKVSLIVIPCIEENQMTKKELVSLIKILKKLISNKKVSISLELNSFDKGIIKLLNKKIGICFDTGNQAAHSMNYLRNLKKNFNKINHIHLKDKILIGKSFTNCRLGLGIVKFEKVFSILKKKKYNGAITLETNVGTNPILEAKRNFNFVKNYI